MKSLLMHISCACNHFFLFFDVLHQGGMMDFAFKFIVKNGGIDSEDDYPYTGRDGRCDKTKETTAKVASIDGFEDVPPNDEASLKKAVAMQPVRTSRRRGSRGSFPHHLLTHRARQRAPAPVLEPSEGLVPPYACAETSDS